MAKVIPAADEQEGGFLRRRNSLVSLRILLRCRFHFNLGNSPFLLILATEALSPWAARSPDDCDGDRAELRSGRAIARDADPSVNRFRKRVGRLVASASHLETATPAPLAMAHYEPLASSRSKSRE